jgi:hypothetical protein
MAGATASRIGKWKRVNLIGVMMLLRKHVTKKGRGQEYNKAAVNISCSVFLLRSTQEPKTTDTPKERE